VSVSIAAVACTSGSTNKQPSSSGVSAPNSSAAATAEVARLCGEMPESSYIPSSWQLVASRPGSSDAPGVVEKNDAGVHAPIPTCRRVYRIDSDLLSLPEIRLWNSKLPSAEDAIKLFDFAKRNRRHMSLSPGVFQPGGRADTLPFPTGVDEGFGLLITPSKGDANLGMGAEVLIVWRKGTEVDYVEVSSFGTTKLPSAASLPSIEKVAQRLADLATA
jgi:hypothetical protein